MSLPRRAPPSPRRERPRGQEACALPAAPRRSEVEGAWACSPRPFAAFLLPRVGESQEGSPGVRGGIPAGGEQAGERGCPSSPPPTGPRGQPLAAGGAARARLPEGFCEPRRQHPGAPGMHRDDRQGAAVGVRLPEGSCEPRRQDWEAPDMHRDDRQGAAVGVRLPEGSCEPRRLDGEAPGVHRGDRGGAVVTGRRRGPSARAVHAAEREPADLGDALEAARHGRRPEDLFLDAPFRGETESSAEESMGSCCEAGSATPADQKENTASSMSKMLRFQTQPRVEVTKPSYFRDTTTMPDFPTPLNSNMSFVYLKKIAERKNDKFVAYVRDITNIYWAQNRPEAKKRKLQGDKKVVVAENVFSDYFESNHRSPSNQKFFEGRKGVISLNCYHHSNTEYDVRDSKQNFTIMLENANWEKAEKSLDGYIPVRLEKSQSRDCNIKPILKRKRQDWITESCKTICQNWEMPGENFDLVQLQEIDPFNKKDELSIKVLNVPEHQSKCLMIETLCASQNSMKVVWLNGKRENDNMLHLRYYTMQKDFNLSNIFESFDGETFHFHTNIFENQRNNSILTWYKMSRCENQIGVQSLITGNMNVNTRSSSVSKYLLNTTFKKTIAFLFNIFDSFISLEKGYELEEGSLSIGIVHINYSRNSIVENRSVSKILAFSRLLEDNMEPMSKIKMLFKVEVLDGTKKLNYFFSIKIKRFPITESYLNDPLFMDFDHMEEITLLKQFSDNTSFPEQLINMENWAHFSFSTAVTHMKSETEFMQNNNGHINERYCEVNMNNQDLATGRKQKHKISCFHFKFTFADNFNIAQPAIQSNQNTMHNSQMNPMMNIQEVNFENLLSETEGKTCDSILEKEVKIKAQSLTNNCQVYKDIEMEDKESFSPMDGVCSRLSISLLNKKMNVEETKPPNQNNGRDRNENQSIFQESELTNPKHYHPKTDSTLYVNHQFESDSSEKNNECFQDLTAKCLSTETLTIAKDLEMKTKFDLVLEELRMFHKISEENEIPSTAETNNKKENHFGGSCDVEEAKVESEKYLKMVEIDKMHASSLPCDTKAGSSVHKRRQSLFKWKTIPNNGEQEVPRKYCYPRSEELPCSTSEEDLKLSLPKRPAFLPDECKEEKYNLVKRDSYCSHGISRVLPLKTCARPIRIGLSRKAKLKQLHPYLK